MSRLLGVFLAVVFWLSPAKAQEERQFGLELAAAAMESASADINYNGSYRALAYPWGDVPASQGVCTDVIIRAYRKLDIDLQKRVHEDMRSNFNAYPSRRIWGLTRPDRNIDHRRVLNLRVFFERTGASLPPSDQADAYYAGDIVTWQVPKYGGGVTPHMGIVTASKTSEGEPLIVHHISGKPLLEDVLFEWPITGHYRYYVSKEERDR